MKPTRNHYLAASVVWSLTVAGLLAQDGIWIDPAGGSWADATKWEGGAIAGGVGSSADFSKTALASPVPLQLDGDRTAGSMSFADAGAGGHGWTVVVGSGGSLTLATAEGSPEIAVANASTMITFPIGGTQGFAKTGGGTLQLMGASTFGGQLVLSEGVVSAGNPGALGATGAGNETVVLDGGTLNVNGIPLDPNEVVWIEGAGADGIGALVNLGGEQQNALHTVRLTGDATVGGSGRFDLRNNTPLLDLAGHALTKTGTNQFSLVGTTVTSGDLRIVEGTLAIEAGSEVEGSGTIFIEPGGVLGLFGNPAENNELSAAENRLLSRPIVSENGTIRNLGSGANIYSPITISGGLPLTLDGSNVTVLRGQISGAGDLVKTGAGSFEIPDSGTFSGKTRVLGGTLGFRGETSLGANPATFVPDAVTLDGGTIGIIFGGFFYVNGGASFVPNRGITLGDSGGVFDPYGHAGARGRILVDSVISGLGILTKNGGGYLVLNGANTYEGGTYINNGPAVFQVVEGEQVYEEAGHAAIHIGNGSALGTGGLFLNHTNHINALRVTSSVTIPNSIGLGNQTIEGDTLISRFIANSGVTATFTGPIDGGINEVKALQLDGGTFVFSGESGYLSDTIVSSGILKVDGDLYNTLVKVLPGATVGGTGSLRQVELSDGSNLLASSTGVLTELGIVRNFEEGGTGAGVTVDAFPETPGTSTLEFLRYGAGLDAEAIPQAADFSPAAFRAASITHDTAARSMSLTFTTATRTWVAEDTETWDVGEAGAWKDGDGLFFQGDAVLFDDTSMWNMVEIAERVSPSSLVVSADSDYEFVGAGSIVGGGLLKSGSGLLRLGTENAFDSELVISGGILMTTNLGAIRGTSGIVVEDGAAFDIGGLNLATGGRTYDFTIEGSGPAGLGAITNSVATPVYQNAGVFNVELTGDASIGGDGGRFDIGYLDGRVGTILGNGHTLTKVGGNPVAFRGDAGATPIHIVIASGNAYAENSDQAFGGSTGTLTILDGARGGTYGLRSIATPVTVRSGGTLYNEGGGTGTWTGEISLEGDVTLTSGTAMVIEGPIGGEANVSKTGGNVLTVVQPNWTGNTRVGAGTLRLNAPNPSSEGASLVVEAGALLDLNFSGSQRVASFLVGGEEMPPGVYTSTSEGMAGVLAGSGQLLVGGESGGGYDEWAASHGIAGALPGDDSDNDGISNLVEYALGLDPTLADSAPGTMSDGVLTFMKGAEAVANGDLGYAIETSPTLGADPSPWTVVTPTSNTAASISYALPEDAGSIFARLKVTRVVPPSED